MKLTLILIIPTLLAAQDIQKTITFEHAKTFEQAKDLAAALTAIGQLKAEATEISVTVTGSQAQIDFAAWTVTQFDRPGSGHNATTDFPFSGDKVRFLRVAYAPTKQAFQEMATAIRSVTQIPYVAAYYSTGGFLFRAQPADLDAAEWIWNQLDRPTPPPGFQSYKGPAAGLDRADTFVALPVTRPRTIQEFQELATATRSIVEARMLFTYGPLQTIVARIPASSVEMLTWLVSQLEHAPPPKASLTYRLPAEDDSIDILYLPQTNGDFQAEAKRIRDVTGVRRAFTCTRDRALLLRGTSSQLAQARQMAGELNK